MPIVLQQHLDEHTHWAVWHITEPAEQLYALLQLDEQEKAFIATLNKGSRYLNWLGTRVLLRTLMQTDEFIDCRTDEFGKPYLVNFPHHISLSHSGNYAAVMISQHRQVGIDIEKMQSKIARIAPRFLTATELSYIQPQEETKHLYACWCAKEALFKWYGKGALPFRENIILHPFLLEEQHITAEIQLPNYTEKLTVSFKLIEEYMLAWVS